MRHRVFHLLVVALGLFVSGPDVTVAQQTPSSAATGAAATGAAAQQAGSQTPNSPVLRAGMIGLDTSHVIAFTELFNDRAAQGELAKVEMVAGFPGGTDIPPSRDRVAKFTAQLRDMGLEIVDGIPELLQQVDLVLLESVDGRPHLEQAAPVILAGKPLFIDKPAAASLADVVAIYELARRQQTPVWSSSSLRYAPQLLEMREKKQLSDVRGAAVWGPCSLQPPMPDLYFYGIHGIETLFTVMGRGCESVSRMSTADTDLVTGVWSGGRVGTYRGLRAGKADFGVTLFRDAEILTVGGLTGYENLVAEIARFGQTGYPPVSADETLEIFAFMDAAEQSKQQNGAAVSISDTLSEGRDAGLARAAEILQTWNRVARDEIGIDRWRQLAAAQVKINDLIPWPHLTLPDARCYAGNDVLVVALDPAAGRKSVELPRLNNPVLEVIGGAGDQVLTLKLSQTNTTWSIPLDEKSAAETTWIALRLNQPPYLPVRPRVVVAKPDGRFSLAAHDAVVHSEKLCYEPLPHKNTLGYWVNPQDWAEWHFAVTAPGHYELHVLQGCGQGQGGSDVNFQLGEQILGYVVEDTGHFQNFQWRKVGSVELAAGVQTLAVRPSKKAKDAIMDIRQIDLRPVNK